MQFFNIRALTAMALLALSWGITFFIQWTNDLSVITNLLAIPVLMIVVGLMVGLVAARERLDC